MPPLLWQEEAVEKEAREKLEQAEDEYKRQLSILESFDTEGGRWSGTGCRRDVLYEDIEERFQSQLNGGTLLKEGGFGSVVKITYRKVDLAKKTVRLARFTRQQIEMLKQEGPIGQSLDSHRHFLKHVGTYYKGFDSLDCQLHLLTFPVANCDLAQFLDDCEEVSAPKRSLLQLPVVVNRLAAMGFLATKPVHDLRMDIKTRLREFIGCLTEAVQWMHDRSIYHRDLKPANILLRPEQVLLTDFGISSVRVAADGTSTELYVGHTPGYAAPEVVRNEQYSLQKADVYSLGCVFLHILAVMYAPNDRFWDSRDLLDQTQNRNVARERLFREYLTVSPGKLLKTSTNGSVVMPFIPPHYTRLSASMLEPESSARPRISEVNSVLRSLSREGEWLYGICCRRAMMESVPKAGGSEPTKLSERGTPKTYTRPIGERKESSPPSEGRKHSNPDIEGIYGATVIPRKPVNKRPTLPITASNTGPATPPSTVAQDSQRLITPAGPPRQLNTQPETPPLTLPGPSASNDVVAQTNQLIIRPSSTHGTVDDLNDAIVNKDNRALIISNMLSGTTWEEVTKAIRGGPLEYIRFVSGETTCRIAFLEAAPAKWFFAWCNTGRVVVRGRKLQTTWDVHSGDLPSSIPNKMNSQSPRRVLRIMPRPEGTYIYISRRSLGKNVPSTLKKFKPLEIEETSGCTWGNCQSSFCQGRRGVLVTFSDISDAISLQELIGRHRILKDQDYLSQITSSFDKDPCEAELTATRFQAASGMSLPNLQSRKFQHAPGKVYLVKSITIPKTRHVIAIKKVHYHF